MEDLCVLVWDDVSTPAAPFSRDSQPPFGPGRMMVYSKNVALLTAEENNKMYGSPTRQMKVIPLLEFLKQYSER